MNFRLPDEYRSRDPEDNYVDGISNVVYQPLIYKAVEKILAHDNSIKYVIDIGCGNAIKLVGISELVELILVDHEKILQIARQNVIAAYEYSINLEFETPEIPDSLIKESLIICSDVVEHIKDPSNILRWLSEKCRIAACVIISTPDRTRERGLLDFGPPANPFHIREWNLDEFSRLLIDFQFPEKFISGYTIDNTLQKNKNTIFAMSGRYLLVPGTESDTIKKHSLELTSEVPLNDIVNSLSKISLRDIENLNCDWVILDAQFGRLSAVPVNKSVNEQIFQANTNGFDAIAAIEIAIDFPKDFLNEYMDKEKPWFGKFEIPTNNSPLRLAAIRKDSLINILSGALSASDLRTYPYTLIGFNFIKQPTKIEHNNLVQKMLNLYENHFTPRVVHDQFSKQDSWHENNSRLEYALELTLQLNINQAK